jgi:hypothetical protein
MNITKMFGVRRYHHTLGNTGTGADYEIVVFKG